MRVVADIMTSNPITLNEESDLWSAQQDMRNLGIHHAPVVDDGKVVGVLSSHDLLAVTSSQLHHDRLHEQMDSRDKHQTFVASVMTREVRTVTPKTSLAEAAKLLAANDYHCLPVVDDAGQLCGMVTESDFMTLVVELLEAEG
ncbi:MAG: CBS domain-containing protein [Myxococcales bacterium]|nr:CBS domain-containing protein [Myxococcales bacterium]